MNRNIYLNRGYILDGVLENYYQVFKCFKKRKIVLDEDGNPIEPENEEETSEEGINGFEKYKYKKLDNEDFEMDLKISPSLVIELKIGDEERNCLMVN